MDKTEAIQVHRTLMFITQKYASDFEDLERYQEVGVKPTDLHKKRETHEEAVQELSVDLLEVLTGQDQSNPEIEEEEPVVI